MGNNTEDDGVTYGDIKTMDLRRDEFRSWLLSLPPDYRFYGRESGVNKMLSLSCPIAAYATSLAGRSYQFDGSRLHPTFEVAHTEVPTWARVLATKCDAAHDRGDHFLDHEMAPPEVVAILDAVDEAAISERLNHEASIRKHGYGRFIPL